MELKEAIEKLANESVEYADIAENVLEGKGKVAEDCREYVEAIRVVLNHLTKQEKMIELIEVEKTEEQKEIDLQKELEEVKKEILMILIKV